MPKRYHPGRTRPATRYPGDAKNSQLISGDEAGRTGSRPKTIHHRTGVYPLENLVIRERDASKRHPSSPADERRLLTWAAASWRAPLSLLCRVCPGIIKNRVKTTGLAGRRDVGVGRSSRWRTVGDAISSLHPSTATSFVLLGATFIHLLACKRTVAPEADDTFLIPRIRCPRAVKPAVRQPFDRATDTRKYHRKRGYDLSRGFSPAPRPENDRNVHHPSCLPSLPSFKISLEFDAASREILSRSFASIARDARVTRRCYTLWRIQISKAPAGRGDSFGRAKPGVRDEFIKMRDRCWKQERRKGKAACTALFVSSNGEGRTKICRSRNILG